MEQAFNGDRARTRAWMQKFLANVEVFDTGGHGATTTFVDRGQGDVLISFESEVNTLRDQAAPAIMTLLCRPRISWRSFRWPGWIRMWRKTGPTRRRRLISTISIARRRNTLSPGFIIRYNDTQMMKANKNKFPPNRLFRVEDRFGGWPSAMATHFDRGGELDRLLAAGHR